MKKIIVTGILFISAIVFAHAPLLSVDDNNDGTIYIEAGFSNGEKAEGMEFLIVKDKPYNGPEDTYEGKMIIFKGKFDEKSSAVVLKPLTPKYEVISMEGQHILLLKKGLNLKRTRLQNGRKKSKRLIT